MPGFFARHHFEETGEGARAMVADGMVKRFPKPDIVLGQHVMPMSAGQIGTRAGTLLSMSDSLEVTLYGRGGHGSSPQSTVDPVVMAAAAVMRLQTIVSRELAMTDGAVVAMYDVVGVSALAVAPDSDRFMYTTGAGRTYTVVARVPR